MKDEAPKTQGMHLATDETVSVAWEQFFRMCREYAAIARQRQAAKKAVTDEQEQTAQEKCA